MATIIVILLVIIVILWAIFEPTIGKVNIGGKNLRILWYNSSTGRDYIIF